MCMSEGCRKRKYSKIYFFLEIFFLYPWWVTDIRICVMYMTLYDIRQRCILWAVAPPYWRAPQLPSCCRTRSSQAMLFLINKHMLWLLLLSYFFLVSNYNYVTQVVTMATSEVTVKCAVIKLFALSEQESLVKWSAGSHCCSKVTNRPAWTHTYHNLWIMHIQWYGAHIVLSV